MTSDEELVAGLKARDETAFVELVERYHERLVGLASRFVKGRDEAEDVVQDTWLAVVRGIDRFEGRSSLRTWLFQVCVNRARSTGSRARKLVPVGVGQPSVDAGRFGLDGAWLAPPSHWAEQVDDRIEAAQLAERLRLAIERLPDGQRLVVTLRDVDGLTSTEVCQVLSISEGNERVLLHRGRSALRRSLEEVLGR